MYFVHVLTYHRLMVVQIPARELTTRMKLFFGKTFDPFTTDPSVTGLFGWQRGLVCMSKSKIQLKHWKTDQNAPPFLEVKGMDPRLWTNPLRRKADGSVPMSDSPIKKPRPFNGSRLRSWFCSRRFKVLLLPPTVKARLVLEFRVAGAMGGNGRSDRILSTSGTAR